MSEMMVSFALGLAGGMGVTVLWIISPLFVIPFSVVIGLIAGLWEIRCNTEATK